MWETAGGEGGFEPPERANAQRFSRPPLSTTQPPLRELLNKQDRPSAQAPIALVMLQVGVRSYSLCQPNLLLSKLSYALFSFLIGLCSYLPSGGVRRTGQPRKLMNNRGARLRPAAFTKSARPIKSWAVGTIRVKTNYDEVGIASWYGPKFTGGVRPMVRFST